MQQFSYQNPHQAYQQYATPQQQVPAGPSHLTGPPRPIPAAKTNGSRWDRIPRAAAPSEAPSSISVASSNPSPTAKWQWNTGKAMPRPPPRPQHQGSKFGPSVTIASAPPRPYAPQAFQDKVSTSPAAATPVAASQWPTSLKSYVERAFAKCRSDADKAIVQSILKEKISSSMTANNLWTKNWDVEILPLQHGAPVATPFSQPPPGPMPHLRPPPPRPPMLAARGLVPPPRPPMMRPPHTTKPSPFSDSFIPLDYTSMKKQQSKATKRKPDMDAGYGQSEQKKLQRQQRFLKDNFHANAFRTADDEPTGPLQVLNDEGELDLDAMIIRGTCVKVEKDYLRLTSVQHIKNEFTVLVYETHARIALEEGDMNEFNQCQTQLAQLYEHGVDSPHRPEFLAYRILYSIYVCLQAKADNAGNVGMYRALSLVRPADRQDATVQHALAVREAVFANNYPSFFNLYDAPPKMTGYLMDAYANHMRLQALKIMCKAYQPSVPVAFIKAQLRLDGKPGKGFLNECGIKLVDNGASKADAAMDCKASEIVSVLKSSAKSLL
ncbi:hypothetical protein DYB34_000847 [Aphanomyces astaci]|uniref:SAC3/GANP/THP3 conserved domain-containing protein n=1 Tax=Aphanomyces astaci TaxID=112090 RepID=A0A3R6ZJV7_APHAT|nr:hypothetical protein DYB34_000847 [Aphanomyces astaci]